MDFHFDMILRKEAIESVSRKLSLPFTGVEQDWEVEIAASERLVEFVSFYKNSSLSSDEKMVLMSLILASYDDFLNETDTDEYEIWDEIVSLIEIDKDFFKELLNYWSMDEENNPENYFKITPLVRIVKYLSS